MPFERILDGGSLRSAQQLWDRIVHSDFELSSALGHRHGCFEFCVLLRQSSQQTSGLSRAILDDDGVRRVQLFRDIEDQPTSVRVDADLLVVNDSGDWEHYRTSRWGFLADEHDFANPLTRSDPPHREGGYIRIALGPYLSSDGDSAAALATWDQATRTLAVKKEDGATVTIRFRTPHDQRRFGTILGELMGQSEERDMQIIYRDFIVDRASPLRLNFADAKSLPHRLGASDMPFTSSPNYVPRIDTSSEREAAQTLYAEIGLLKCDDTRDILNPIAKSHFEEQLGAILSAYNKQIAPLLKSGGRMMNFDVATNLTIGELEIAYPLIEAAVAKGGDPIVDDPNMIWLAFDRAMHARVASMIFRGVFWEPLLYDNMPFLAKIKACMAMGEFGPPVWVSMLPAPTGPKGPFLQAILHARWNWPPTDDEIKLCHAKLNEFNATRVEKEAAVDCLIRWGRLNDVPGYRMEVWFKDKVAATPTHRHCTWKALTRTPDGRQFLRERLDALASTPEIQRDIAAMLCCRAEATLDMKRWDFMSEEECRETLRHCQPLAGAEVQKAKFTPAE